MVVLIVCIKRQPNLSREEFSKHWRDVHGPLVASVPEFAKYVRRYAQYHMIDSDNIPFSTFGDVSSYDGVAALWFDDAASIGLALTEPRYLSVIRPDEANFIDEPNCMSFVTRENVVIGQ